MTANSSARVLPGPLADSQRASVLVLAGRELRDGIAAESTSRYRDDVWNLAPALLQKHQRSLVLDFTTLPEPYHAVAKDLFHAKLAGALSEVQRPIGIVTIRSEFTKFKIFAEWLEANGSPRLAQLGPVQVDAYRQELTARGVSANWCGGLRRTVRDLWVYRDLLSDPLTFDPTTLEDWYDGKHKTRVENATDRIPEPVLGPLVGWALRWVEELSVDILAARQEWAHLFPRTWTRLRGQHAPGSKTAASDAAAVFDRYRAAGRPLPGGPAGVNISHLAREVGCHRVLFDQTIGGRRLLGQALADLGIDDDAYLWTPLTARIDGRPWLNRMPYRQYAFYEQRLNAACYIVISYLSGMRDSEVKHLRRGCLSTETTTGGQLVRHKLTSLAFKGETSPLGVTATWVVGAPVANAISILEQLQPPEQQWLFAPLPTGHHRNRRRNGQTHTNEVLSGRATNDDIAGFITWINDYCTRHGRHDGVPHVQGRAPAVLTSQFRRTLAWFIARRPGGSIAGAIAYRHHGVQMFEGYAGTSDSGFRAEVEAEQGLARGEDLTLMVERHEHQHLAGPAAEQAELRLREFGQHVRFAGAVPTDRRQLAKLIARHDPHIYPGRFVTCVHNPDRALCHNGDRSRPSLGDCQPLACRNVALTDTNTAAWHARLADLDGALAEPDALAPFTRNRLNERREQIKELLSTGKPT